jgi:LuxR family transcriptional regulator, maltose regulon positive regulatory protein
MEAEENEPSCSIERSLEILGERWTFLILRSAFSGTTRFADFRSTLGIAPNLLSAALIGHARGDLPAALAALERALTLAEPEGYVRVFVGEGPPMASLLRMAAKQGITLSYVQRLLAAVNRSEDTPTKQDLIEPLSERELDVLRLLGSDLDGPDIARELTVSLNTLRTHTRNIYAKLGVNSRRAAVRQAADLNLLSRGRDR